MAATPAARPASAEFRVRWLAAPVYWAGAVVVVSEAGEAGEAGTVKMAKPPVGADTVTVLLAVAVDMPEAADIALE